MYQEAFQSEEKGERQSSTEGKGALSGRADPKAETCSWASVSIPHFGSLKMNHVKTAKMLFAGRISPIEMYLDYIAIQKQASTKLSTISVTN